MNPLLIVRSEIVCLIILAFILLSSRLYKMGKDTGYFFRICIFAIGHVVFDLITVLTVNHLDTIPPQMNRISHIIFYVFALLFAYEFFCYTISLCYAKRVLRQARLLGFLPLLLYFIAAPFLPIEFLTANGTNYSFGTAAIAGYGVAILLFLASIVIVVTHIRILERQVVGALMPMLCAAIAAELVQIAIPELLFTGGAVTIITVGFFFSLENPVAVLQQKMLIDALTGVQSRHCYEADILRMEKNFSNGTQYGMVFCDINGLKDVNDTHGHMEGDIYIGCIAQILSTSLKHTEAIYRMGGDEFLAIYKDQPASLIREEVNKIKTACEEETQKHDYPVSVAIGYAISDSDYTCLKDVLRTADYQMYSNKTNMKRQHGYPLNTSNQLNVAGLTDRIFDAFAETDTSRFFFVTNMATNVTRWSHSAVEYLDLGNEFIYDCSTRLAERIHSADRDTFLDDVRSIYAGNGDYHELEFRIRNGNKTYVACKASGTLLQGKNGKPDLFAGAIAVQMSQESIDNLTSLRTEHEMLGYFNHLIHDKTPAGILQISILNLSRINILYGYDLGNKLFKQFSTQIRSLVGNSGSVFRADGNRLVICIPNSQQDTLSDIYRRLRLTAEQRIRLDTVTPPLQLAAGACLLPADFDGTASALRSNLNYAYYRSKHEERGRLVFYESLPVARDNQGHKNLLLRIHQDAIAGREGFYLLYQPIVNAKTGKIIGAEALLRWKDEGTGIVSPGSFIPWLEEDPCFFGLGNWILRRALADAARVLAYQPDFVVNINIAVTQLEHEGFRNAVLCLLKTTGFPPHQLCLELTERCRELNPLFLKEAIEFFRSRGILVALDDLGTGFSSFGLLLSLNVDEVKLDHTFVKEIRTQRVNQVLTRMLIDASRNMGYSICLEGVEDKELCRYLNDYGATYYQGYFCSRPTCVDSFIALMRDWNNTHDSPLLP